MCLISTPRSPGQHVARVPVVASSRFARSGRRNCPGEPGMAPEREAAVRDAAEAVARRSYGKLVALLAARTRDVAGAEDALADAFASALVDWPMSGVPRNPEAWLLTVARRKWIDADRRRRTGEGAADHLALVADEIEAAARADAEL